MENKNCVKQKEIKSNKPFRRILHGASGEPDMLYLAVTGSRLAKSRGPTSINGHQLKNSSKPLRNLKDIKKPFYVNDTRMAELLKRKGSTLPGVHPTIYNWIIHGVRHCKPVNCQVHFLYVRRMS